MKERYPEIDEVITFIHQHLDEPLPLSRLAKYAAYSPYHFTRVFKERTGLPPLYYVSSLRLQKAKELLLETNLSIRDIGMEIGQQSLGTFTTRFTQRVGVTPAAFRNSAEQAENHLRSLKQLKSWGDSPLMTTPDMHMNVEGTVQAEEDFKGVILIGLFGKPIPEGVPLYGTLLSSPGKFQFANVKPGTYYLMATSVPWHMGAVDVLLPRTTLRARLNEPIIVGAYSRIPHLNVTLRAPQLDDPPILISLPLLMNNFLRRMRLLQSNH